MAEELFGRQVSDKDQRPLCIIEEVDKALVKRIRQFVKFHRRAARGSKELWEPAIARLRRKVAKVGIDEKEFLSVWDWYIDRYTPASGLPMIANGQELADRWDWIMDRRERENARRPVAVPTEKSPEVIEILDLLGNLVWPKGSEDQLPAVVSQSFANYSSFKQRLSESVTTCYKDYRETILFVMAEPVHFLERWFTSVWRQYHKWNQWNGDMGPHVWTPTNKRFIDLVNAQWEQDSGTGADGLFPALFVTDKAK